ncbi:MAG: D-alanyl-D-alanine carboxypeptidase [Clostridia bacterium]|nr:D-alanyl-D-alanine carboxypeptidase [Clostridia bacterium]
MRQIRGLAFFLAFLCAVLVFPIPVYAEDVELEAPSVILMEAESGTVLYEKNADEMRHPASVTKVMTLLLVFEAIDSGKIKMTDSVTVSDRAASMGGSQVFLEVGEQMSVEDQICGCVFCQRCGGGACRICCGKRECFCGSNECQSA